MSASTVWTIVNQQFAQLQTDSLTCQLNLRRPNDGLQQIQVAGSSLAGTLPMQLSATPILSEGEQLEEAYVRGSDVVATYRQGPGRSTRPQIYWRYINRGTYGQAIELLVSTQTDNLESDPRVAIASSVNCLSLWHLACQNANSLDELRIGDTPLRLTEQDTLPLLLARNVTNEVSYGEIIYPSDFAGVGIHRRGGAIRLEYELFAEPLEKGVIRSGRALSLFVPSCRDEESVMYWYHESEEAVPPLTV